MSIAAVYTAHGIGCDAQRVGHCDTFQVKSDTWQSTAFCRNRKCTCCFGLTVSAVRLYVSNRFRLGTFLFCVSLVCWWGSKPETNILLSSKCLICMKTKGVPRSQDRLGTPLVVTKHVRLFQSCWQHIYACLSVFIKKLQMRHWHFLISVLFSKQDKRLI